MIHLVKSQLGLLRERMLPVKRKWTGQSVVAKRLGRTKTQVLEAS
jgi:hypothetical protein